MTIYSPLFNKVLVEIDDKDARWGKGSDDNIGGEVFREGKVLEVADDIFAFGDTAQLSIDSQILLEGKLRAFLGKQVMWHEGHEAGTVFEENGKKYALIYWFDLIGIQDDK